MEVMTDNIVDLLTSTIKSIGCVMCFFFLPLLLVIQLLSVGMH
jgi:hypothetical protein